MSCSRNSNKNDCLEWCKNIEDQCNTICGWCSTNNECYVLSTYCSDTSKCEALEWPHMYSNCDDVHHAQKMIAIAWSIFFTIFVVVFVWVTRGIIILCEFNKLYTVFIAVYGILWCAILIALAIAVQFDYQLYTIWLWVSIGGLFAFISCLIWVLMCVALKRILQNILNVARKPVNKYILVTLVLCVWTFCCSLGVIAMLQLFIGFEWINAVTFLSLFILGYDIIELTYDIQTDESKSLLQNMFNLKRMSMDNEEIELKQDSDDDNAYAMEQQSITVLIWHLCAFTVYVGVFLSMSFIFEELETCFSNFACLGVSIITIWAWIRYNNVGNCYQFISIVTGIAMMIFTVLSCVCIGECIEWSISMTAIAFIWAMFILAKQKLFFFL